jgi:chorismate lyase/3-hydroxybenzoate synthase
MSRFADPPPCGNDMTSVNTAHQSNAASTLQPTLPTLRFCYEAPGGGGAALDALLAEPGVLAVIGFGADAPATHVDPRYLHVALQPVDAAAPFEVWRASGRVSHGRGEGFAWACDGDYTFGAIELAEAQFGDIEAAAEAAYRRLGAALAASTTPHALRIWNYLDAINLGAGDAERYRRFCAGRAAGLAPGLIDAYPAATAIGVRDGRRVLQVYWLAARVAGQAVENPRQLSAWRYPRRYGIKPPTFARAMRAPSKNPQVYISGTAAIIGHASHHHDDFAAQLAETLTNIDSLLDAARLDAAARFGPHALLKAYVRRDLDLAAAADLLGARLPAATPLLLLRGDICRSELLIEIDGVQNA